MPEQSDIKKALELILGYTLPEEVIQLVNPFANVATYDRTQDPPGSYFLTKKNMVANLPNECERINLLTISGWWFTGDDGKSRFRLTDFLCEKEGVFEDPISIVVTPVSDKPYFATVLHSLVKNQDGIVVDVEIQVSTWDASGAPAPGIAFDWHCRAAIPIIIL